MAGQLVTVTGSSRIHLGLLDLGDATPRMFGGAGFSVKEPEILVGVCRSEKWLIRVSNELDRKGTLDLQDAVNRFREDSGVGCAEVEILHMPPQHVGLGSKTALILATLVGLNALFDAKLDVETIQKLSGRGGGSGVGVWSFFLGGFIVDAGHDRTSREYVPSGSGLSENLPILQLRAHIPNNWRFFLLLPPGILLYDDVERAFFAENTPIPRGEILEAIAILYHGIVPSIISANLRALADSLSAFQKLGFKRREIAGQSVGTEQLIARLKVADIGAVGMSSMGPLVFVIAENGECVNNEIQRCAKQHECRVLASCEGSNTGFEIKVHD